MRSWVGEVWKELHRLTRRARAGWGSGSTCRTTRGRSGRVWNQSSLEGKAASLLAVGARRCRTFGKCESGASHHHHHSHPSDQTLPKGAITRHLRSSRRLPPSTARRLFEELPPPTSLLHLPAHNHLVPPLCPSLSTWIVLRWKTSSLPLLPPLHPCRLRHLSFVHARTARRLDSSLTHLLPPSRARAQPPIDLSMHSPILPSSEALVPNRSVYHRSSPSTRPTSQTTTTLPDRLARG
jgi:hypothetical protein